MIEKQFFHVRVFEKVLDELESLDIPHIATLAIAFHFAKKAISDYEENIYFAINANNLEGINLNYHSFIEHLYETLFCYPATRRERASIFSDYYRDDIDFESLDLGEKYLFKMSYRDIRSTVTSIFKRTRTKIIFYYRRANFDLNNQEVLERVNTIIRQIVQDVNDLDNWKEIERYFHYRYADEFLTTDRNKTFLSYSFKDKTYALFLFDYFYSNGGFLYVDNLIGVDHSHDPNKRNATIAIKESIHNALSQTSSFLLLRSVNDENKETIRPWCSFEIGLSHRLIPSDSCFYIDSSLNSEGDSFIYNDFDEFHYICRGLINH